MKSNKSDKSKQLKIHWGQSSMAWLAGIKPIGGAAVKTPVNPILEALCRQLLGIGGERACVLLDEPPLNCLAIAMGGEIVPTSNIQLLGDLTTKGYSGMMMLWKDHKETFSIYTGYSLSDDKVWRRHAWLLSTEGIIEADAAQEQIYFGIPIKDAWADAYCEILTLTGNPINPRRET